MVKPCFGAGATLPCIEDWRDSPGSNVMCFGELVCIHGSALIVGRRSTESGRTRSMEIPCFNTSKMDCSHYMQKLRKRSRRQELSAGSKPSAHYAAEGCGCCGGGGSAYRKCSLQRLNSLTTSCAFETDDASVI